MAQICLTRDTIRRMDIVSRCFENKNNHCCETKNTNLTNPYSGHPIARTSQPQCGQRICQADKCKQMAFLFDNNYCFFFNFKTSGYNGKYDGYCENSKTNF